MSNMFRQSNRFSSLMDDDPINENKENPHKIQKPVKSEIRQSNQNDDRNYFKNNGPNGYTNNNSYNSRNNYFDSKIHEEQRKKNYEKRMKEEEEQKERERDEALKESSFPDLLKVSSSIKLTNKNKNKASFIDKLKTETTVFEDTKEETVGPGCVVLQKDKTSNNVTIRYGETNIKKQDNIVDPLDVLYDLTDLHEKRMEEYMDSWFEDDFDKAFLFQNYDYHYFDNLDEIYQNEMEFLKENERARLQLLEENNHDMYYNKYY